MLQALRVRDFRLLWGARLVSSLGSWLLVIAVPAHVFAMTGSLSATGLTVAAEYLPSVILGPFAGVVADRGDRRRLMVGADLFRAVAVASMLAAQTPGTVWIVYLALVAESAGTGLFRPAAQAHTPVVVGTGPRLSSANSLNAFADGTVRLVGGPVGAVLMVIAGFNLLVLVDSASYLASAAAIMMTRLHGQPRGQRTTIRDLMSDLTEGWSALRSERFVRALLPITVVLLLADAALSALLVPYGLRYLGGSQALGVLMSALGVGFLLGAPLSRLLVDRCRPQYVLSVSLAVTAIGFYLLFHSGLVFASLAAAGIGTAGSVALTTPTVWMQRILPNAVLGRICAIFFACEATTSFAGALLGPAFAQTSGLSAVATGASVATLIAAAVCLRLPQARSGAAISAGNG
ncbi:MFS transporter [Actinocrispum wychmicini]|uniref:Putative MFS family arabinose efflux permease n=1 Tax=Actinocrispum wychmicini TaxID=1213861 RepID=A0A4R2IRS8_9PSEU|nr:MFS transporter [Actinocrispum wychmicini]TCO48161.1 putative MFS family arabinose efflux permease [Actinocrispum wychmicini]